jgi:hypothetical protein
MHSHTATTTASHEKQQALTCHFVIKQHRLFWLIISLVIHCPHLKHADITLINSNVLSSPFSFPRLTVELWLLPCSWR